MEDEEGEKKKSRSWSIYLFMSPYDSNEFDAEMGWFTLEEGPDSDSVSLVELAYLSIGPFGPIEVPTANQM